MLSEQNLLALGENLTANGVFIYLFILTKLCLGQSCAYEIRTGVGSPAYSPSQPETLRTQADAEVYKTQAETKAGVPMGGGGNSLRPYSQQRPMRTNLS